MTTTRINITPYLAEYLIGKYGSHDKETPIKLPDDIDLYHALYDLMQRRPKNASQFDNGNLWLCLPGKRYPGKDPQYFNYISERSAIILQNKIAGFFFAELHEMLDYNKHAKAINFEDTAYYFINMYSISSISVDGLLKNYQRWRDKVRKRELRRKYEKKVL